jgi:hypothetical protein
VLTYIALDAADDLEDRSRPPPMGRAKDRLSDPDAALGARLPCGGARAPPGWAAGVPFMLLLLLP